jgi:hypothetical protein
LSRARNRPSVLRHVVVLASFHLPLVHATPSQAEWVVGINADLALPRREASVVPQGQAFETGAGVEAHAGYRFRFDDLAVRPEMAVAYTNVSFPLVRWLVGARLETTWSVSPFVLARGGAGGVSYRTNASGLIANPTDTWRSGSGSAWSYQLGGGLTVKLPEHLEAELLVATNVVAQRAIDDDTYVDARWYSVGVGGSFRF